MQEMKKKDALRRIKRKARVIWKDTCDDHSKYSGRTISRFFDEKEGKVYTFYNNPGDYSWDRVEYLDELLKHTASKAIFYAEDGYGKDFCEAVSGCIDDFWKDSVDTLSARSFSVENDDCRFTFSVSRVLNASDPFKLFEEPKS